MNRGIQVEQTIATVPSSCSPAILIANNADGLITHIIIPITMSPYDHTYTITYIHTSQPFHPPNVRSQFESFSGKSTTIAIK